MEYLSSHKRIILVFLVILAAIPLASYFWADRHPRSGSCLILEEKNCRKVQFISDPINPVELLAAYKVPVGTRLFSPISGELSNTPKFLFTDTAGKFIGYPGMYVTDYASKATGTISTRFGFIFFKEKDNTLSQSKKGNLIGTVSNKTLDYLGDFNLLIRVYKSDKEGKTVDDTNLLKTILGPKK